MHIPLKIKRPYDISQERFAYFWAQITPKYASTFIDLVDKQTGVSRYWCVAVDIINISNHSNHSPHRPPSFATLSSDRTETYDNQSRQIKQIIVFQLGLIPGFNSKYITTALSAMTCHFLAPSAYMDN